jgi:NADH-quinone oxidoreductase subunit L
VIHALHGEQDIRNMGGLKKHLPITFWTFLIASLAIAGVPGLAGFFSKDEILYETFSRGYQWLWTVGVITSLLTATYMFRLVYLTFYGEPRFAPAHGHASHDDHHGHGHAAGSHGTVHLHDAPPAMAIALVLLALGSVLAGYIGVPHALGGSNRLGVWLDPAFEAPHAAGTEVAAGLAGLTLAAPCEPGSPDVKTAGGALAGMAIAPCEATPDATQAANATLPTGMTLDSAVVANTQEAGVQRPPGADPAEAAEAHGNEQLELMLMGVSSLIALLGIGLATWLWLKSPATSERIAAAFPGLHRLLLNKYYVDEFYDVTVVQPVKIVSEDGLWRVMDARLVDGAVNGAGQVVGAFSAVFRLFQTGSVKTYAASTFLGVVVILGYYIWR